MCVIVKVIQSYIFYKKTTFSVHHCCDRRWSCTCLVQMCGFVAGTFFEETTKLYLVCVCVVCAHSYTRTTCRRYLKS